MSVDGVTNNASDMWNSSFYSSNSIDIEDHAKNFRNSLVLEEIPRNEVDLMDMNNDNSDFKNSIPYNDIEVEEVEEEEEEVETANLHIGHNSRGETMTMNMTTSPSLSALAGILSEKSLQADKKMRSSMILNTSIIEEDEIEEEKPISETHHVTILEGMININHTPVNKIKNIIQVTASGEDYLDSPNLIDINGSNNISFSNITQTGKTNFHEQPDFLSSPNPNTIIPSIRLNSKDLQENNTQLNTIEEKIDVNEITEKDKKKLQLTATPEKVTVQNPITSQESLTKIVPTMVTPVDEIPSHCRSSKSTPSKSISKSQRSESTDNSEHSTTSNSKKKSIFSFLKKKTPKQENNNIKTKKETLPSSNTFSVDNSSKNNSPEKLTKKSQSNNSIFNTFRKKKEASKDTLSVNKVRSKQNVSINSEARTKIYQRKPTPLNFEANTNIEVSQGEESHSNFTGDDTHSTDSDNELLSKDKIYQGNFDTGVSLFPKSLDSQEVESIISLERNRSIKTTGNNHILNPVGSHKKSLSESLSTNAQNEGMFISEATSVALSTPDLTKSPASSILRNGRFSSGEVAIDNFNRDDYNSESGYTSLGTQLEETHENDFSFGSIEEQLNSLTIDSDTDSIKVQNFTEINDKPPTIEDDELMSDIMEFANIINFGDGINFDLDMTSNEQISIEQNSLKQAQQPHKMQNVISIDDSNDEGTSDLHPQESKHNSFTDVSAIDYNVLIPARSIDFEEDFENEDFNHVENDLNTSSKMNTYLPEIQPNRPISMSFRGLGAPTFNQQGSTSLIVDSPTISTRTDKSCRLDKNASRLQFSTKIILYETYSEEEYDRHPDIAACNQLTPQLAQMIKIELNALKSKMEIHEASKCYTHFY